MKNNIKILILVYIISLIMIAVFLSGYTLNLDKYCSFAYESEGIHFFGFLLCLFVIPLIFYWVLIRKKIDRIDLISIPPIILFFVFVYLSKKKKENLLEENFTIITQAIITKKTNSKLSWFVKTKFKVNQDTIIKELKINGNVLKTKKKGDTILIKYIKDCPNIVSDFNFSPSKEEMEYYKGGKIAPPKE